MPEYLKEKAFEGLKQRLTPEVFLLKETKIRERLILECDVISKMGFSSYFLIVADFVIGQKIMVYLLARERFGSWFSSSLLLKHYRCRPYKVFSLI